MFIYDLYEFEYRCEIYVYSVCRALSAYHIEYWMPQTIYEQ